jgi:hypothetical protein
VTAPSEPTWAAIHVLAASASELVAAVAVPESPRGTRRAARRRAATPSARRGCRRRAGGREGEAVTDVLDP